MAYYFSSHEIPKRLRSTRRVVATARRLSASGRMSLLKFEDAARAAEADRHCAVRGRVRERRTFDALAPRKVLSAHKRTRGQWRKAARRKAFRRP